MSSLCFLLRCECLQFELCNLIWCRTRPVTQPQEGRLTLRLLSRRSMLRQPPHALIFHLFLICALFFLFPTLILLSLCSCCLSFNSGLIPHYCLIIHEQTRHIAQLVFVRWNWLSYVNAGSGLTSSELVHMWGFCFWNWENKSNHAGPWEGSKCTKRWAGEAGKGRKYQLSQGELRLTYSCSKGQLSDFSHFPL